jgi:hypothetical protein
MATYPLTWLADVLRAAGCRVVEEDGWKTRGRDGAFDPEAVMLHHDASPAGETSGGVDVIRDGRPGLEGPLSQLWLSFDGTWHVVAAGRANHAGEGGPWGRIARDQGNRDSIGIETDHTTDEQWSDPQRSEALRGVHALCQALGITTRAVIDQTVCAHKEYTDRKVDPDPMDMDNARAQLAAYDETQAEGLFGMSEITGFSNPNDQIIKGSNGAFKTLQISSDGALSLLTGPKDPYLVTAGIRVRGTDTADSAQPGDRVEACLQAVIDYPDERPTEIDTQYPIHELTVHGGSNYLNIAWTNTIGGDTNGGRRRLRLFIRPPDGRAVLVAHVTARVLT